MTFAKVHLSVVYQHFHRSSPLKLLGRFHLNFIHSPRLKGKESLYTCLGHMAKMTCPYVAKTLFFSPEWLGWLPLRPWVDLEQFHGRVKFVPQGFQMEKAEFIWYVYAVWYGNTVRFNSFEILEVKSFGDLVLKVICLFSVGISNVLSFKNY